jgi:hypothetical protein
MDRNVGLSTVRAIATYVSNWPLLCPSSRRGISSMSIPLFSKPRISISARPCSQTPSRLDICNRQRRWTSYLNTIFLANTWETLTLMALVLEVAQHMLWLAQRMGTLTENKETAGVTRQQKFIYFAFRWASRSRERALSDGICRLCLVHTPKPEFRFHIPCNLPSGTQFNKAQNNNTSKKPPLT